VVRLDGQAAGLGVAAAIRRCAARLPYVTGRVIEPGPNLPA
jgi:hypothetical protein